MRKEMSLTYVFSDFLFDFFLSHVVRRGKGGGEGIV